jgi:hypothetical protein
MCRVTKGYRSKRRNSPYIFQVVASLPTKACFLHACQIFENPIEVIHCGLTLTNYIIRPFSTKKS